MRDRDLTTFVALRPRLRAAVPGHRREQGARRPRPALEAADGQLPPAGRRDDRQGEGLLRRRRRAGLPQPRGPRPGRRPGRPAGRRRPTRPRRSRSIRAAFLALKDTKDWTGDGRPENWKVIDRMYTKAEARYIPNGADSTADMAHPTRTGDLVVFSSPPYQFDAATPGTPIALSAFFGQHGYVPDVQDLQVQHEHARDVPRRWRRDRTRRGRRRAQSIDLAPTAAFLLGVPAPQHSQGVVRRDLLDDGRDYTPINIIGPERLPRPARAERRRPTTRSPTSRSAARRSSRRCSTRRRDSSRATRCCCPAATTSAPRRPSSSLLEDMPTIDVLNAWNLDATAFGNHEFDYGPTRILKQQARVELRLAVVEHRRDRDQPAAVVREAVDGLSRQRRVGSA